MKILLTGGTGFLGSNICQQLLSAGHSVDVALRETSDIKKLCNLVGSQDVNLRLIKYTKLDWAAGYDTVIHSATAYGRGKHLSSDVIEANLVMPLKLLEESIKYRVRAFINTDTYYTIAHTDHPLQSYIRSKKDFFEWACLVAEKKIKFINMRIEHLYGPSDSKEKFCNSVIEDMLENKERISLTECDQLRDFVYVRDAAKAYLTVLCHLNDCERGTTEIGVGSGVPVPLKEYVTSACEITGSNSTLGFGDLKKSLTEINLSCANNTFLIERGWSSDFDLKSGIKEIIQAMKAKQLANFSSDGQICE